MEPNIKSKSDNDSYISLLSLKQREISLISDIKMLKNNNRDLYKDVIPNIGVINDKIFIQKTSYFHSRLYAIQSLIEKLKSHLNELKNELGDKNKNNEIKDTIKIINTRLNILKVEGKNQYQSLCNEEKSVTNELNTLKNDSINDSLDTILPLKTSVIVNDDDNNIMVKDPKLNNLKPIVIGQFQHSWHNEDHKLYLQYFSKYKNNKDVRILKLKNILTHINEKEILSHDIKYSRYVKNIEETKQKINDWRTNKNNEQIKNIVSSCSKEKNDKKELNKSSSRKNAFKFNKKKDLKIRREHKQAYKKENVKPAQNINKTFFGYTKEEREVINRDLMIYKEKKLYLDIKNENNKVPYKKSEKKNLMEFRKRDNITIQVRQNKIEAIKKKQTSTPIFKFKKSITSDYRKPTISSNCYKYSKKQELKNSITSVDFIPKRAIPNWRHS